MRIRTFCVILYIDKERIHYDGRSDEQLSANVDGGAG